jgi:type II restriction enzyme
MSAYCPNCGDRNIEKYKNNEPVADFFCKNCHEDFELKSKQNSMGKKVIDGAYNKMLERITDSHNPNFFFLNYDMSSFRVINFLVVPKHFFIPDLIEKRKPLTLTARRAGWVGCNILLNKIPGSGKIFFVRNGIIEQREKVLNEWKKTLFLRDETAITSKGWLLDTMKCIDKLGKSEFAIDDIYSFENELSKLYPNNKHIKDKIRQQLQFLRDKGYLSFISKGYYRLA